MPRLSETTIDKLNDKINFIQAFRVVDLLYEARTYLNDEVMDDLGRLVKKLDDITEGYDDDDEDNSVFDLAFELEDQIMEAQERLEAIYDVLSSVTDCCPDPDEDYKDDND